MALAFLRPGALPLLVLFALPLLAALGFMLDDVATAAGWAALWLHPQLWGALGLSLGTAVLASLAALFFALLVGASAFEAGRTQPLARSVAAMLAVPHLAFAIGLGFLLMPSGLVARALAPLFGWDSPPGWITTHDPYGLMLALALACKEAGFLLFTLLAALSRPDIAASFRQQGAAAQALGHGSLSIWLRLFLPQLWPSLRWPFAIVFIYAATVVDMALVLGPTQPPTLALLAWSDLNSANAADEARGAAAAGFLALASALVLVCAAVALRLARPTLQGWMARGPSALALPRGLGRAKWRGLEALFLAVMTCLLLLSLAPLWPFPGLVPPAFSGVAWREAWGQSEPLLASLGLASVVSITGLGLCLAWLEAMGERQDQPLLILASAALALPGLLLVLGQYRLLLRLGLTGSWVGLYLVHLTPALAYMFILLRGPYRAYDPRYAAVAASLSQSRWRHRLAIKWPLLKAPLASSLAVGFAVSFGQFLPAQLVAAGRHLTLPMEAVALSSGGNRSLTAAFALLLMGPPLLAFLAAGLAGRQAERNA